MRSDDLRTLPDRFLGAYRARFGTDPPREFVEAYAALAEAVWFGSGESTEIQGKRGKRASPDYWFGDDRLLEAKWAADVLLLALAERLEEGRGRRGAARARAAAQDAR